MQTNNMMPRLLKKYREEIIPAMVKKFGYKTSMQAPRVEKIVVNMGVGEAIADIKMLDKAMDELALITGQKPIMRRAKIAISNFKIREGLPIGCKLTLRKNEARQMLMRLLEAKDRRLNETQFDDEGNISFGIGEYIDVPGVKYDPGIGIMGFQVCITLERPGFRIKRRKLERKKIPLRHSIKKEDVNKPIKIIGVSKNIINKGKLTKIELEDKSGKIDIIVFNSKKIPIKKGSTIEVYGKISVYENKPQIYAETIKIIN